MGRERQKDRKTKREGGVRVNVMGMCECWKLSKLRVVQETPWFIDGVFLVLFQITDSLKPLFSAVYLALPPVYTNIQTAAVIIIAVMNSSQHSHSQRVAVCGLNTKKILMKGKFFVF